MTTCLPSSNRDCCCFSSWLKATLPFRKLWHSRAHLSGSWILLQKKVAVMEVRVVVSTKIWLLFISWAISWPDPSSSLCAGIVVEDCLLLLLNLLKNNSSNQNFFKEGSYIQRMKPWFEVGDDNSGWSAQKVTNLHLMLQVKQNTQVKLFHRIFKWSITLIRVMVLIPAGASHGVSSELSWGDSQLSEVHVPVWPAAAAMHHPHGHWCSCWHPHWGIHNNNN